MTTYHPPPGSFQPPARHDPYDHAPRTAAQRWGAILWPSFFAAGVATMVFFAVVDPEDLNSITWAKLNWSREAGYTLGFFMFWLVTFSSSLFTWILLRPASRFNKPLPDEDSDARDEREDD
jgi:hypothetical protein